MRAMAKHAHNWDGLFAGFVYCLKCGLLRLKNTVSRKAAARPCPGSEE